MPFIVSKYLKLTELDAFQTAFEVLENLPMVKSF